MEIQQRDARRARWAQWALLGLIALIVVAPFLFMRQSFERSLAAQRLVAHTSMVEATAMSLAYETRNLESATLALGNGIDSQLVRERIVQSRDAIPPLFDRLHALVKDNAAQQVRLGILKDRIDQRMELALRVVGSTSPAIRTTAARELVTRFPVRNAIQGLVDEERVLFRQREMDAEESRLMTSRLGVAFVLLQLGLLGLLMWLLHRHQKKRLEAETSQRATHARAQAVMESIREPLVSLDDQQRIVLHNPAFAELYAADGELLLGQPLQATGQGAWSDAELQQRLRDVLARGRELWDYEVDQTTRDGIARTVLVNARRVPLPGNAGVTALLTATDITARKASELQVKQLNMQLAGKVDQISDVNRELEAFSYSVSHDLRAPLRHISGFADKLKRHLGDTLDDKGLHYLDTIRGSGQRMAQLIDDLLVYSRLGRSALRLQAVDMQSLVEETRQMLEGAQPEGDPHRILWEVGALPVVVADENMMRQVWGNLLGNAVKYSAQSEPARIGVRYRALAHGAHEFTVQDNGVGFDMTYAAKLFGVFQRLHGANEFAGTGIGLASVKRVLTRHHGDITAHAVVGEGSTFCFTLPANPEHDNSTPATFVAST